MQIDGMPANPLISPAIIAVTGRLPGSCEVILRLRDGRLTSIACHSSRTEGAAYPGGPLAMIWTARVGDGRAVSSPSPMSALDGAASAWHSQTQR